MSSVADKAVYVAYCKDAELTKIGISKNPQQRVKNLPSDVGGKVELIGHSDILANCVEIENFIKDYFSDYNYDGEWFSVNPRDMLSVLVKLPMETSDIIWLWSIGKTPMEIADMANKGHGEYHVDYINEIINTSRKDILISPENRLKYKNPFNSFRLTTDIKYKVMNKRPMHRAEYKIFDDDIIILYDYRYFEWANKKEWEIGKTRL